MKKFNRIVATIALAASLASPAFATTSSINPTQPAQNAPLLSSTIRALALAAYNDINTLFGFLTVGPNQYVGSVAGGQAAGITLPNCPNGLGYQGGFLCASGTGITTLTGDVTATGPGSATAALANTATARNNIGLGAASVPIHAGIQLTKNITALPTAQTGTVAQLANIDATVTRSELDSFGTSSHYTTVRFDGTNASPTAVQSGDLLGSFNSYAYDGTAVGGPAASFQTFANQNWAVGAHGTYGAISVTPNGSTTLTQQWKFENDGGITATGVTGGDKGVGTINMTGCWVNGVACVTGSTGSSALIPSRTPYSSDTAGNLFPYLYTGAGGNAAASEWTQGVVASLGSNVALQLRFPMPSVIPSGTFKMASYCLANASSGVVKYTISDAMVGAANPSAATLTGETQTSITWGAADTYVITKTNLTAVPVADQTLVAAVTFNNTGWTLAAILGCNFYVLWE